MFRWIPLLAGALAALAPVTRADVEHQVPDGFQLQTVASGLTNAVGFSFLPDGRALVIEKQGEPGEGLAYLVVNGHVHGPVLTVPDVNTTGLERGLLGITVDPAWPERPYVYVQFTHTSGFGVVRMYTAGGDLTDANSSTLSLADPYDLITDLPDFLEWHNGGTLRFGPDGMLYVSHGDDAADTCDRFQNPDEWHGVILRLDVGNMPGAGTGPPAKAELAPADNPFTGGDNAALTYCYGLRNPFRFTIDSVSGELNIGDVGEVGYEELNVAIGGDNFGWPLREGAHDYPPGQMCGGSPGTDPIYEIAHDGTNAFSMIPGPRYRPTGGAFDFPPAYDGNLFALDFYAGWVRRFEWDAGADMWLAAAPEVGQPNATDWAVDITFVSDIQMGPDGAMYMTRIFTDDFFCRIVRVPSVSVPDAESAGAIFTIAQNPGAFGSPTTINFDPSAPARLQVFDVAGRLVDTLTRNDSGTLTWLAPHPGTYFLRNARSSQKLTILP